MAKETELVLYARVGNEAGLLQAAEIYDQEQAQVRAPNGNIRVRMERKRGESPDFRYELTTKHFTQTQDGIKSCEEKTEPCTAAQYEMFKSVCDQFMRKVRYVFYIENVSIKTPGMQAQLEVPGLKYEVDRFISKDGTFSEWVKIDLELDALYEALKKAGLDTSIAAPHIVSKLSMLPFDPQSAFYDDGSKEGPMRDLVTAIYDKQFVRPLVAA